MKTMLDLCCGKGGWALGFAREGWRCIGVDCEDFSAHYPGIFIRADLLKWDGWLFAYPDLILASPPCQEFSRHDMPWTRKKNPPPPSLDLVKRCFAIAEDLNVPMVLENVRGAQKHIGRSKINCGPFHLWGDVPAIVPVFTGKKKKVLAAIRERSVQWFPKLFPGTLRAVSILVHRRSTPDKGQKSDDDAAC